MNLSIFKTLVISSLFVIPEFRKADGFECPGRIDNAGPTDGMMTVD